MYIIYTTPGLAYRSWLNIIDIEKKIIVRKGIRNKRIKKISDRLLHKILSDNKSSYKNTIYGDIDINNLRYCIKQLGKGTDIYNLYIK